MSNGQIAESLRFQGFAVRDSGYNDPKLMEWITGMKKKIRILGLCLSLCAVILWEVLSCNHVLNSQILSREPFKKVQLMQRHAILLNVDMEIKSMDVSVDERFHHWNRLFTGTLSIFPPPVLAVMKTQSRFFVGNNESLFEFDSGLQLIREIPLSLFNLGEGFRLLGHAEASEDRLWFTIRQENPVNNGSISCRRYVVEWKVNTNPAERIVSPEVFEYWTVDPVTRILYIPTKASLYAFDYETALLKPLSYAGYGYYIDFASGQGLLLSNATGSLTPILRIAPDGNTQTICKGGLATWGSDGTIYFCRGSTQLWRCTSEGENVELVFAATAKHKNNHGCNMGIHFSQDKTFLAFQYSRPSFLSHVPSQESVLIDLSQNEWRILPDMYLFTTAVVWIDK